MKKGRILAQVKQFNCIEPQTTTQQVFKGDKISNIFRLNEGVVLRLNRQYDPHAHGVPATPPWTEVRSIVLTLPCSEFYAKIFFNAQGPYIHRGCCFTNQVVIRKKEVPNEYDIEVRITGVKKVYLCITCVIPIDDGKDIPIRYTDMISGYTWCKHKLTDENVVTAAKHVVDPNTLGTHGRMGPLLMHNWDDPNCIKCNLKDDTTNVINLDLVRAMAATDVALQFPSDTRHYANNTSSCLRIDNAMIKIKKRGTVLQLEGMRGENPVLFKFPINILGFKQSYPDKYLEIRVADSVTRLTKFTLTIRSYHEDCPMLTFMHNATSHLRDEIVEAYREITYPTKS